MLHGFLPRENKTIDRRGRSPRFKGVGKEEKNPLWPVHAPEHTKAENQGGRYGTTKNRCSQRCGAHASETAMMVEDDVGVPTDNSS
ncbi:hypothetical protein EVAR_65525_1 [Eumeta japonica]|uniref:Uncharacterized protein n=1 Tax=Eumeta variegata TaxID=151549 RepID=A0A4C1ZVB4_EUMVA|nr:hypothetical protein EVAR_65525_1 [Eumeta japonica]